MDQSHGIDNKTDWIIIVEGNKNKAFMLRSVVNVYTNINIVSNI